MTERDDRSTEKVTGAAQEFRRLAGFLARELALPVLTPRDGGSDGLPAAAGWAATGAMWLTGHPDGPPLAPPAAVVPAVRAAAAVAGDLTTLLAGPRGTVDPAGPAGSDPVETGGAHPAADPAGPAGSDPVETGGAHPAVDPAGAGRTRSAAHAAGVGGVDGVGGVGLRGTRSAIDVAELLTGRAAWMGLRRAGRTSANGSCRLLRAADGWVAVNLARPSDVEAVPALVERAAGGDPWVALAAGVARMRVAAVVERGALLALPVAALGRPGGVAGPFRVARPGESRAGEPARPPLVVDLSSMWAGPLCARLLGRAGLRVVKVESTTRPDGARAGDARFFAWLHGGHESVGLDLASDSGRRALRDLVGRADVVLESSRPRALAQMGIDAERVVASRPGVTWVSITGHGRSGPAAGRVAFGDDAAVAAGLVAWDGSGEPVFCSDAIADPITGLYAAVGALASLAAGGGHLLDVAMVAATRFAAATPAPAPSAVRSHPPAPPAGTAVGSGGDGGWVVPGAGGAPPQPVVPPVPPQLDPGAAARPLGADTGRLLAELVPGSGA